MSPEDEIQVLLSASKAQLIRQAKHKVYALPDGRRFTIASTPSDHRAAANQVSDLRKLLGIKKEIRKNPERRDKPGVAMGSRLNGLSPTPVGRKTDPFAGLWFPSIESPKYQACRPVWLEPVPMTPFWCWMRRIFGYGGPQ